MAYVFETKPVATIKAKTVGDSTAINVPGVTTASTTPTNAAAQINKILAVAGKEIGVSGMTRTQVEEAVDNG
ncbi:MAG: hypothetical protein IJS69_04905 [Selenomonadaceae bacterium]|nr:hypothetical protein [Selenomonadaceae bacterium]